MSNKDTGGGLAPKKELVPLKGDFTATLKISQLGEEVFATLEFDPLVESAEIANTPAYILMSQVVEYYLWRIGVVNDDGELVHPEALGKLEDFDVTQFAGGAKIN